MVQMELYVGIGNSPIMRQGYKTLTWSNYPIRLRRRSVRGKRSVNKNIVDAVTHDLNKSYAGLKYNH